MTPLQTVSRKPRFYRLIESFCTLTGIPMVLNTSFNENEPVVCRPEEALECFLRTKMDVLIVGDVVIYRQNGHGSGPSVFLAHPHQGSFGKIDDLEQESHR